jgi:hypothetical protein
MSVNKLPKIFPKYKECAFTIQGIYSATLREISEIVAMRLMKYSQSGTIFELCCGIGSDTLSLCRYFNQVYINDLSEIHLNITQHNIQVHSSHYRERLDILDPKGQSLFHYHTIDNSLIYIDPPWEGGLNYLNFNTRLSDIFIDDQPLLTFVETLVAQNNSVCLKLPTHTQINTKIPFDIVYSDRGLKFILLNPTRK